MAPELFLENARPSQEADIYAFGIVVYEVVAGVGPFGQHRVMQLHVSTTQGLRPVKPEDPVAIGFGLGTWEFIERCWDKDHGKRPSVREAVEHFEGIVTVSAAVDPGPAPWTHPEGGERSTASDNSTKGSCGIIFLMNPISPF